MDADSECFCLVTIGERVEGIFVVEAFHGAGGGHQIGCGTHVLLEIFDSEFLELRQAWQRRLEVRDPFA